MSIQILSSTAETVFSSPVGGGVQSMPQQEQTTTQLEMATSTSANYMTALSDVDPSGLNNNDVLVYDQLTGKFKPVDVEVVNNNDGGVW